MAGEHGGTTPASPVTMGAKERRVHRTFRQKSSMEPLRDARSPPSAQKLQLPYHLPVDCEQLCTSLLDAQMARHELYLCAHLRAAWTDVGGVGVVRRPIVRNFAKFSHILVHLRLDPVAKSQETANVQRSTNRPGKPKRRDMCD